MALIGTAALAMWWNMEAAMKREFEDWHSHEHFPERLAIPGFRRSSRWMQADGGEGVFVLYELENYGVLSSPGYLQRLNAPTPWSTRLMPHHRQMVRSQSHVLQSRGGFTARHALTLRLSPAPGRDGDLQAALGALIEAWPHKPGFAGAHLLRHETPDIAQTTEQKIRGVSDQVADLVLVVCAYEIEVLQAALAAQLSTDALLQAGAATGIVHQIYSLSCSALESDLSDMA